MGTGEIPDSDPGPFELDPSHPIWTQLGLYKHTPSNEELVNEGSDTGEPPPPPPPPPSKRRKRGQEVNNQNDNASNHTDDIPNRTLSEHSDLDNFPRRRRFNFEKWVAEDRKVHEYVYHKRFREFHGALSDSEDEDYADLQGRNNEITENSSNAEDFRDELEITDDEASQAYNNEIIRRRKPIESDSSDSENDERGERQNIKDSNDNDDDVVPIFERRLTKSIPAVSKKAVNLERFNNSTESQLDSSQSSIHDLTTESLSQSLPDSLGEFLPPLNEADEDRGGIDYMMNPQRRRIRKNSIQPTIVDLARKAGSGASKALKIAARTANVNRKRTSISKPTGKESNQPRSRRHQAHGKEPKPRAYQVNGPVGKLFVNQSRETMRTLRRWWNGRLDEALESSSRSRVPKDQSSSRANNNIGNGTNKQTSTRNSRNPSATVIPAATHTESTEVATRRKSKPRKPVQKRHSRELREDELRTTIIERPLPQQTGSVIQMPRFKPQASNPILRETSLRPAAIERSESNAQGNVYVRVLRNSPSRFIRIEEFGLSTFLGTNLIDLLEGPNLWNGIKSNRASSILKVPVSQASQASIASDASLVLHVSDSHLLDQTLYLDIYQYILQGTRYLCDESEIVESKFRRFVLHEWLRLARKLLKMSIRRKWNSKFPSPTCYYLLLTVEVLVLAVMLINRRSAMIEPADSRDSKVNLLVGWTIYYHQLAISLQVDNLQDCPDHERPGVELVYLGLRVADFNIFPSIFSKSSSSKSNWHLLELCSAVDNTWTNWNLARWLIASDINNSRGVRIAMSYTQRLLAHWNWPASADIIADLFVYYSKQQHYADPLGESIWLPTFLLTSSFDGSNAPDQDFSMFLELLGFTLRKFQNDPKACLRIAGRVTPLSALSFPETEEVSLSDLSSASHQYGILIVLLRMLAPSNRPSISQFRDLVVLRNAHWAIKIKAVSAWNIVVRLVDPKDFQECMLWMRDEIFYGDDFPENLVLVALKSSLEVLPWAISAVPVLKLMDLGLRCNNVDVRVKTWQLVARCTRGTDYLTDEIPFHLHYADPDYDSLVLIFRSMDINRIGEWCSSRNLPSSAIGRLYTKLFETGAANPKNISSSPSAALILVKALIKPNLTDEDRKLLLVAGLNDVSSMIERRIFIRQIVKNGVFSDTQWAQILIMAEEHLLASDSSVSALYTPLVSELRRLAFAEYPHLSSQFHKIHDNRMKILETMQENVLNFSRKKDFSCYYYFAYRLKQYCPSTDSSDSSASSDSEFIREIIDAISLNDDTKAKFLSDVVFNYLFASFFDMASKTYGRTLKSRVSYILPTLVKATLANIGRGAKLEYDCLRLIDHIARYITSRINIEPMIMAHPPTIRLVILFSELVTLWLHQSYGSNQPNSYFGNQLLVLVQRMRYDTKNLNESNVPANRTPLPSSLPDRYTLPNEQNKERLEYVSSIGEDIISAFRANEFDEERGDPQEFKLLAKLEELQNHIYNYLRFCRTNK